MYSSMTTATIVPANISLVKPAFQYDRISPLIPTPIPNVHVEIIEQPTSVGVRFRYKCEGRSAGCIRGASSSEKLKTYPTIKVCGYQGNASCVVSCVTKDGPPYYPHPHNLVGKQTSGNGVCFKNINTSDMTCSFPNLGIQCVKKRDIADSLKERQRLQIDPFGTGFSHINQLNKINLNTVRLCFQVIIADNTGKICVPLPPVISEPIFDNKTVSDLNITKLSHASAPVIGGQQIILLCDQVSKDDIEVLFYEEKVGNVVWSTLGKFLPQHVHRKAAIVVTIPPYKTMNISHPLEVFIQLRRPSDGAMGKSNKFTYLPLKYDPDGMIRKRQKCENMSFDCLLQSVENEGYVSDRIIKRAIRSRTKNDSDDQSQNYVMNPNVPIDQQLLTEKQAILQREILAKVTSVQNLGAEGSIFMHSSRSQGLNYFNGNHLQSSSRKTDILETAMGELHGNNLSAAQMEPNADIPIPLHRFGSLDLGFDPVDLDVNLNEINFDSFPDTSGLNLSLSEIDIK